MTGKILRPETCGGCKFAEMVPAANPARFQCHRNPPKITTFLMAIEKDSGKPMYQHAMAFPVVEAGDWCGEYKPKIVLN